MHVHEYIYAHIPIHIYIFKPRRGKPGYSDPGCDTFASMLTEETGNGRTRQGIDLYEERINLKKLYDEVYYTNTLILLVKNMLCSKLHYQKVSFQFPFHIKTDEIWTRRLPRHAWP